MGSAAAIRCWSSSAGLGVCPRCLGALSWPGCALPAAWRLPQQPGVEAGGVAPWALARAWGLYCPVAGAGVFACPLVPAASGAVAGQWASRVGLDGQRLLTAVSRVAGGGLGPVGLERARSSGAGILVRARCGPSLSAVCHPYGVYSCSCRTRVWGARCGRRSVALSRTLTGFLWRRPSGSAAVVGALWPGAACGRFLRARTGCGLRCVLLALVRAWLSAGFALCGRLVLSRFEAACAGAFLLLAAWG